jgi:hypothetical protein
MAEKAKVSKPKTTGKPAAKPTPKPQQPTKQPGAVAADPRRRTPAETLLELAKAGQYFCTDDERGFASVPRGGDKCGRDTVPINSKPFRHWLTGLYYRQTKKPPGTEVVNQVLGTLEAQARYDNPTRQAPVRVAEINDAICIDLANDAREAVVIQKGQWEILEAESIPFYRPKGMAALPRPVPGGNLADLRELINVASDEDWLLLLAWLTMAFRPRGPYPVLCLHGEQGSGKSTFGRMLRSLVDPNTCPLRSEPRKEDDILIAASRSWVLAYDNLSHLPEWLSDALCRISTGGGISKRQLYTDDDEVLLTASRPVILTSIADLATRGDLLSRCLLIRLPAMGAKSRLTEKELWEKFEQLRPRLLGCLLDAVARAHANEDDVVEQELPRMADFARWSLAAEPALPQCEVKFLDAYRRNLGEGERVSLEESALVKPLQQLLSTGAWTGQASELLEALAKSAGIDLTKKPEGWPRNGRALGSTLRRLSPALRNNGIQIEFPDKGGRAGRQYQVSRCVPPEPVPL